jgi:hypothetical protein
MFTNTNLYVARHPATTNLRAIRLLTEIRQQHLQQSRLIVAQQELPMIHYYDPQTKLKSYTDAESFRSLVSSGEADAVVFPDLRLEPVAH